MDAPDRRWLRAALLVAAGYGVIGITFGPAGWRLGAFLVSAVAFGAHITYEQVRLGTVPRLTAWHSSVAVALGAFALAVSANLHALRTGSGNPRLLALALVAWPLLCGLPAFIVALGVAAGLSRTRRTGVVS